MDKEVHEASYEKCNGIVRAWANSVYQASPWGEDKGDKATTLWENFHNIT